MAAFSSDRRSGWVRVLVLILCALFIFAVIATPPAFALSETVALFTAASVLSAAVAALGFKLSSDAEGQATLNQMVKDFAAVSWSLGLVAVGDKVNGLLNGVQYIKMQVLNGKTYLDDRIVAWCQQWLGAHGVYDAGSRDVIDVTSSYGSNFASIRDISSSLDIFSIKDNSIIDSYNYCIKYGKLGLDKIIKDNNLSSGLFAVSFSYNSVGGSFVTVRVTQYPYPGSLSYNNSFSSDSYFNVPPFVYLGNPDSYISKYAIYSGSSGFASTTPYPADLSSLSFAIGSSGGRACTLIYSPFFTLSSSNDSGLSGTDTIGADYKDKTLDQILDGLKDWAQDWYDAGADSVTNTVAGAKDLPLTVGDQAASANPALNPDVVYNPPFALPLPDVRSGETTAGTITAGQENASAAETATSDVAENQTVIDSLVTWALNYINPDTGLFSKFPLCVPYDAYLLVTSSLGVDAVGSDSIFGASPDDLNGVVTQGISTYSDFQPIINIDHDFELDGATYPISITIDLSPWQPLVTFFREGMALLLVAELIGSEYKRIRGH